MCYTACARARAPAPNDCMASIASSVSPSPVLRARPVHRYQRRCVQYKRTPPGDPPSRFRSKGWDLAHGTGRRRYCTCTACAPTRASTGSECGECRTYAVRDPVLAAVEMHGMHMADDDARGTRIRGRRTAFRRIRARADPSLALECESKDYSLRARWPCGMLSMLASLKN